MADASRPSPENRTNVRIIRALYPTLVDWMPGIAARIGWRLFTSAPRRMRTKPRQEAVLRDAQQWRLRAQGQMLHAYAWGHGPVVVLLHGWGGAAAQLTPFVDPLVAQGYRVVAIDGPAHGRSTGKQASVLHFADALRSLQAQVGPLHAVVAHSMGAASTARAVSLGLDVDRLALIAPASTPRAYFEWFAALVGLSDAQRARLEARLARRTGVRFESLDVAPQLAHRAHPVLVVHDVGDEETTYAGGAAIAAAAPNGELLTTVGLGHNKILWNPQVVEAVTSFVAEHAHHARSRNGTHLQERELVAELACGQA